MAFLIIRTPEGRRVHELQPLTVVGRSVSCDIQIDDPRSSKRHLEIASRGGRWVVRDLDSTNGTLVGGEEVRGEVPLEDGEAIVVGSTTLVFSRTRPCFAGLEFVPASTTGAKVKAVELPVEQFSLRSGGASGDGATVASLPLDSDSGHSLRTLYRLLREASQCETEEQLFASAVRLLGEALPEARVRILPDSDVFPAGTPSVTDTERLPREVREGGARTAYRLELLARARKHLVAVLSPDVDSDARVAGAAPETEPGEERLSLIAAPLLCGPAVFGFLVAERTFEADASGPLRAAGPFTQRHLEFLGAAAYPLGAVLAGLRRRREALDEVERLRQAAGHRYRVVGESAPVRAMLDVIRQIAPLDSHVLVLGESGTGKELVARMLHTLSPRRSGPLEIVNCGAIPENLIESELFGHIRGAFTGAVSDRAGCFEQGHGGTLFLDEIGELPMAAQTRLLRVLEEGLICRVGDSRPRRVDCRIVAATHRDLMKEVQAGRFRHDLYYRLYVLEVRLPPLRERLEDLEALCGHLLSPFGHYALDPEVLDIFRRYPWPGNIRELRNALERMAVMARAPELPRSALVTLTRADVPLDIRRAVEAIPPPSLPTPPVPPPSPTSTLMPAVSDVPAASGAFSVTAEAIQPLEKLQRDYARWVLEQTRGNKSRAAKLLGIQRSTLYAWTGTDEEPRTPEGEK